MTNDRLEFYDRDKLLVSVRSSIIPSVSSYINIAGKTWVVIGVTYAVDQSQAAPDYRVMRANIDLKRAPK